jgi:hypothetical protein
MIVIVGLVVVLMAAWGLSSLAKGLNSTADSLEAWKNKPRQPWYVPVTRTAEPAPRTPGLGRFMLVVIALGAALIWIGKHS